MSVFVLDPNEYVTAVYLPYQYQYSDIRYLYFHGNTMHFLPLGLGQFFPYLQILRIDESGLKTIGQEDLRQFPYLRNLRIYNSDIERLDSNLFYYNPELKEIDISVNPKLRYVGRDILKPLTKLEQARISGECNNCWNCGYTYSTSQLPKLIQNLEANCWDDRVQEPSTFDKVVTWFTSLFY